MYSKYGLLDVINLHTYVPIGKIYVEKTQNKN